MAAFRSPFLACYVSLLFTTGPADSAADSKGPPGHTNQPALRTDRQGDPLPQGASARLGAVRCWHGGPISALAVSPDGRRIITAESDALVPAADGGWRSGDGTPKLRVFDAATGKETCAVEPEVSISALAISHDGRTLAAGSLGRVVLFDLAQGKAPRKVCELDGTTAEAARFSRDGKTLITSGPFGVQVWDLVTRQRIRKLECPEETIKLKDGRWAEGHDLRLSPDGQFVACVMDIAIPDKQNPPFSSSGGCYAAVYDAATRTRLFTSQRFRYSIGLTFSPDSRFLALGGDRVQIVDLRTRKVLQRVRPGSPWFWFSHDSRRLAVLRDGRIDVVDLGTGRRLRRITVGPIADPMGLASVPLAFSPDDRKLWLGQGRRLRGWDIATGKEVPEYPGQRRPITFVAFSSDGSRLYTASDMAVAEWNVHQGIQTRAQPVYPYWDPSQTVAGRLDLPAVSVSLGRLAWLTTDRDYELRDLRSGRLVRRIPELSKYNHGRNPFLFAGAELWTYSIDNLGGCFFWRFDGSSGKELGKLTSHALTWSLGEYLTPSPDGQLLAACDKDGRLVVLDAHSGQIIRRCREQVILPEGDDCAGVYRVQFSPDGRYLASMFGESHGSLNGPECQRNAIQLWEIATGREVGRIVVGARPGQRFAVAGFSFSPDDRYVAFGMHGSGATRIWEIASESELACLGGQQGTALSVAFSPAGDKLASGGEDGTVLIWNMPARPTARQGAISRLSPAQLERYWQELGAANASAAAEAMRALIQAPRDSLPFLARRLKPVAKVTAADFAAWIRLLDSRRFSERNEADVRLREWGLLAEPALRAALEHERSLEAQRRIQSVLASVHRLASTARSRRQWRGLEIVERIGNRSAQDLLRKLADGADQAPFTRSAQASLARLKQRGQSHTP